MSTAPTITSVLCTAAGSRPSFSVDWTTTGSTSGWQLNVFALPSWAWINGASNMQQSPGTWSAGATLSEDTPYQILIQASSSNTKSQPVMLLFFPPTGVTAGFDGVELAVSWTPPVGATQPTGSTIQLMTSVGDYSTTTNNRDSASFVVPTDLLRGRDWQVTVTPTSDYATGPTSDPAPVEQTGGPPGGGASALRYALASEPPRLATSGAGPGAHAILTLVAANPGQDPVALAGLAVTIPIGTAGTDLGDDGAGIATLPPAGWELDAGRSDPAQGRFVFAPLTPPSSLAGEGLAFVFQNVAINQQPGTAEVAVDEGLAGVPPASWARVLLPLSKFPGGWGPVDFVADPCIVAAGGATTLRWAGPAGATYLLEYPDGSAIVQVPAQGDPPLAPTGSYPAAGTPPLALTRDTVFTLTVSKNVGGQTRRQQVQRVVSVLQPTQSPGKAKKRRPEKGPRGCP